MYFDYFGIQESPFSITPDPKFMYFSQRYEEALAHLLYGIGEGGGFVLLTGEVGTGKTTVCRYILDQIPDTVDLALILNPKVSEVELLANICDELHIPYLSKDLSVKSLVDLLNKKLLELHAKDRRPVLIIDEAQNLAPQVLEQIRLLTNLETAKRKLLQIILVGQPELNEMLARPELRQVSQRVTARYHLYPLSKAETAAYIAHRLSVVDIRPDLFTAQALAMVYKLTRGVPRLVNVLCDRCLLAAFVKDVQRVGPVLVKDAYKDVQGPFKSLPRKPPSPWILGGLSGGAVAAALFLAYLAFGSGEMAEKPGNVDSVATPALAANVPPETATPNANQPIAAAPTSAAPAETASPTAAPQEVAAIDSVGDAASAPLVETPEAEAPVPSAAPAPAESVAALPSATPLPGLEFPLAQENSEGTAATATEPAPAPPYKTRLFDAIEENAGLTETLTLLFGKWGVDYATLRGIGPCSRAMDRGLRCLQGNDGLAGIKGHDRPALVSFALEGDTVIHAALIGVTDTKIYLDIGESHYQVDLGEFLARWDGSYTILWNPPPQYESPLAVGMAGEGVNWLRQSLAGLKPFNGSGRTGPYDNALRAAVRDFQRTHGLAADGIAGPNTLMKLNAVIGGADVPTLQTKG